tara:strand:+ start:245 stop:616 length:372 start_codon:yes stop_codon:yes gene_type:complete
MEEESEKTEKLEFIKELLDVIDLQIDTYNDLYSLTIPRKVLLAEDTIHKFTSLKDNIKSKYKSDYLNCLHNNSILKQQFPAINMLRQLLRCNKLHLYPFVVCSGYNVKGGKIRERFYKIKDIG